ncbi:hypothetical protein EZV73_15070 [Acidaminobacter sp. JC074]|uniref:hypothetical protein n=1 Tax=Acidaminobacter sp. JC074 TaxID=2530199 RepID=UPI001F102276|nr:hypothetical protein [Acidaminobacter sp. JC074]MCH4888915.1 hypothetical protein [Acidaminobacter sp. JC074]
MMYSNSIYFLLGISICISPIFSGEYTTNVAPILLASRYGKNKLPIAKMISVYLFGLVVGFGLIIISYFEIMLLWGSTGGRGPFQLLFPFVPYPITIFQATIILVISIMSAVVLTIGFTTFLPSKFKSPFWVIILVAFV